MKPVHFMNADMMDHLDNAKSILMEKNKLVVYFKEEPKVFLKKIPHIKDMVEDNFDNIKKFKINEKKQKMVLVLKNRKG